MGQNEIRVRLIDIERLRRPEAAYAMYLAVFPLVVPLTIGEAGTRAFALGMLALFGAATWILARGMKAAQSYRVADVARRPRVPLKLIAAAMIGLGLGFVRLWGGADWVDALLSGGVVTALVVLAFGPDPLKDKGLDALGGSDRMRANEVVRRARAKLAAIGAKLVQLDDPELDAGFARFDVAASHLFHAMQGDPARQRSLRKHVGVFIDAAAEATDKFSVIYRGTRDAETKSRYLAMIDDLAQQFEARARRYLLDGKGALDVEIDVLQSRMHDTAT